MSSMSGSSQEDRKDNNQEPHPFLNMLEIYGVVECTTFVSGRCIAHYQFGAAEQILHFTSLKSKRCGFLTISE